MTRPASQPGSGGLIGFYERLLRRLRGRGRSERGSLDPLLQARLGGASAWEQEHVDLVREPEEAAEPTTFGAGPDPGTGSSSDSEPASSSAIQAPDRSLSQAWSFNKTVLLRPRRRPSSVLAWTAVGSVTAVGIWAFTAPLAETIAVQGKLEPGSATRRIDAPVPGVVEAVLVQEGQQVRRGDPLVRFDLREPRSRLAAAESNRERLRNENRIAEATLGNPAATAGLTANQRQQLASQRQELTTRQEAARQELRKAEVRLQGERADLSTYRNKAARYQTLVAQGAASEIQLLDARQLVEQTENRVREEEREIARLRSALVNTGAATNVELRRKVEENLSQIATIDSEIRLARQQIQYGRLMAPTDGTVFDIEVTPGSVVAQGTGTNASTSSKPLLKIVPHDALRARVYVPNSAIGFVHPGLKAQLSIEAFRASDFGYIPARVLRVGSDALTSEEQSRVLGTDTRGLFYPAILQLDRQSVKLLRKSAPLQAGMTLTADINLRERRFINILTQFMTDQRRNLERLR